MLHGLRIAVLPGCPFGPNKSIVDFGAGDDDDGRTEEDAAASAAMRGRALIGRHGLTGSDWSTWVIRNTIVYQYRPCIHMPLGCTSALYTCSHTVSTSESRGCGALLRGGEAANERLRLGGAG